MAKVRYITNDMMEDVRPAVKKYVEETYYKQGSGREVKEGIEELKDRVLYALEEILTEEEKNVLEKHKLLYGHYQTHLYIHEENGNKETKFKIGNLSCFGVKDKIYINFSPAIRLPERGSQIISNQVMEKL